MNTERPCDTEDWSNDAENSSLHHRNDLHIKKHSNRRDNVKLLYYLTELLSYCSIILFTIFTAYLYLNKCSFVLSKLKVLSPNFGIKYL